MSIQEYVYITFYLLEGCLQVVLDQLQEWLYKGQLIDELNLELTNDFILFSKEKYHNVKDERWWHNQFILCDVTLKSNNMWLFDDLSKEILRCGKSIKLLSLIDDSHALLYNSKIVKYRPPLRLYYVSGETNKSIIEEYVQVVKSIAADTLKSQKEIIEEKRRKSKFKAFEAQKIRDQFLKSRQEKIIQQKLAIHKQKSLELDRLKLAAGLEKERKLDSIAEEKRMDKELMDKTMEKNRKVIDELKYDLTKLYAKKFADAEAREKLSLDHIKEFKLKLRESRGSVIESKETNSTIKEIIGTVIEEVQQVYDEDDVNESIDNRNHKSIEKRLDIEESDKSILLNFEGKIDEKLNEDSIFQQSLFPGKTIKVEDKHIIEFQKINLHGHTSDSTAEKLLYPDLNKNYISDKTHLNKFRKINIHGHVTDSSAVGVLYPDTHKMDVDDTHMDNFQKFNIHGDTTNSVAEESLHSDKHENIVDKTHIENFQKINNHGHFSDSTVQKSLYPQSHKSLNTGQILKKENMEPSLTEYSSNSSLKHTLYPNSLKLNFDNEQSHINHFKSINAQGHVSQSSVQELMYPYKKQMVNEHQNNSSIVGGSLMDHSTTTPVCIIDDTKVKIESEDWLSVIRQETTKRTELLNTLTSHTTKLRNSSIALSSYQKYTNDIFRHIDRSILSSSLHLPINIEFSNQSLIIEDDPIDITINRSLISAIMAQVKLADTAIMFTILNTYKFRDHLKEIRKFVFLEDGKFSASLLPSIFELVSNSNWINNTVNRILLLDVLKSSVNCLHSDHECFCKNICLAHGSTHNSYDVKFNNQLDNFSISYSISWPINIIIQQKQLFQYQSIFRAIVQIKYSLWCLKETQKIIKSWNSKSKDSSVKFRPLYLCLSEMEHWVRSMDSSLGNQVSGSGAHSWREMINKLDNGSITNIDSLIESHAIYLDGVILRCVLGGDNTELTIIPSPVKKLRENIRKILIDMLGMCSTYYRTASINYWQADDYHQNNNNKIVKTVTNLHKKFRKYGDCLLKIIKSAPEDSYLEHLFVCLDYNEFYYKHTLV